ncbi:transcription termination factor NusA [Lentisphaerota bacterium WC36G]|nr:transcription termination factor NusA [Lentisphaerae bacterium WC36]
MNSELLTILEYIEQERGINRSVLIEAVQKALKSAAKKGLNATTDLDVKIDELTGEIKVIAQLEVVECLLDKNQLAVEHEEAVKKYPDCQIGDHVEWVVTPKNFGRIAAQTAKQAIMQQIRQAEKESIKAEFEDKVGELVNGVIRRFDHGNIIVELNKAEAVIGRRDKMQAEQYMVGERVTALLKKIDTETSGPSLILSRTSPRFVAKLFEREVSEIHDGVVEIKGVAREAGLRTKIAVDSADDHIDPIGACVGMRGMRVRNITDELNGERVDIIRYDSDIAEYVKNALQPAELTSVEVDEEEQALTVYVTKEQSRLAFGKKAQNVRLASKLMGWSINIETINEEELFEESIEERREQIANELAETLDLDNHITLAAVNSGFLSVEGLSEADEEAIEAIEGLDDEDIDALKASLANVNSSEEDADIDSDIASEE